MEENRKIICPSCKTVLSVTYMEGIESKSFACPRCNTRHRYTEYLPYPVNQDETDLDDVLKNRAKSGQYAKQTDETELGGVKKQAVIGCLRIPGTPEPVQLKPDRNSIGRKANSSTADIQIEDSSKTMSRCHYYIDVLVFENTVRHLLSIDPAAVNRTELNGNRIEATDKLVLNHGDRIRSGQVEVEFVLK